MDNIALTMYFVIGYVITYLGLEPCLYKQVKMMMTTKDDIQVEGG
ncbi:MAG: hypothetical protein WA323_16280 [Candidatus Nitrosopolaris sp.]